MRLVRSATIAAACLSATMAAADPRPPELIGLIDAERPIGSVDVSLLFFDLYRANMWTPGDRPFDWSAPFALSLTYERSFSAEDLASSSIDEIARIARADEASFAALEAPLKACFADVDEGDRITGVSLSPDQGRFFVNARKSCDIVYPDFSRLFFGIWMDPRSRDPEAAEILRGAAS